MTTTTAMLFGALIMAVVAGSLVLSVLVRFVSTDVEGFRKWLDRTDIA